MRPRAGGRGDRSLSGRRARAAIGWPSCGLALLAFARAAVAQHTEAEFDPWRGIDEDGRIPKVDLPDDLPNPDRWRYIPEGRLKPGNVF
ncbi:MAG TPA: hypothetical protein VEC18_03300, partial [Myxococcota bacterium]|nr:hypothetical protein [Myxococcota bacterium]